MTPPHFQIGQEVENIGPDNVGCTFEPERFTISMLWKDDQMYYSAEHQPWYLASSLRLVEELKVGDWVEVIGPHCDIFVARCDDLKIFKIEYRLDTGCYGYDIGRPSYPPTSLRKLTPDEIAKHTCSVEVEYRPKCGWCNEYLGKQAFAKDGESFCSVTCSVMAEDHKKLAAIEREMKGRTFDKTPIADILKRLTAIESRLDHGAKVTRKLIDGQDAIEKRLAILEGEQPEVCEGRPNTEPIRVTILAKSDHTEVFTCPQVAMKWCQKVLDSMKET